LLPKPRKHRKGGRRWIENRRVLEGILWILRSGARHFWRRWSRWCRVMKLKFGFVKVRYRGLLKNANRLFTTCALVNLFMIRKQLLCPTAG
jgi:IS5 family transposase